MKNYTIYFEIFGKKLKTTVLAETENEAKRKIINKIIWHKIEEKKDDFNQAVDFFNDILDKVNNVNKTRK